MIARHLPPPPRRYAQQDPELLAQFGIRPPRRVDAFLVLEVAVTILVVAVVGAWALIQFA